MIGPALIAVTAIAAAVIAAKTANRRQGAQLKHSRELQADQLAHDRELQKAQLAYDRRQRGREHTRVSVDDATRGVERAIRILAEYEGRSCPTSRR